MMNTRHAMARWGMLLPLAVVLASPVSAAVIEPDSAGPREDAPVADAPKRELAPVMRPDADAVGLQPKAGPAPMPADPEPHTPADPFLAVEVDTGSGGTVGDAPMRPPLARLFVGGTTTWRRYCARPGVKSCGEYDRRPEEEQVGDTSDYSSSVPYLGFSAELELLPLARRTSAVRGLGLVLGYRRGYAATDVTLVGEAGQSVTREVAATDSVLTAQAMYRYFFGRGEERQLLGYAGIRAGLLTRAFDVEESPDNPLAGTHRL
ncbi:hypothetical protein, partial [Pyxidicoccus fallax]